MKKFSFDDLRPLVDWEGNETCGFILSNWEIIPTPSLIQSPSSYSIGRAAWKKQREACQARGLSIIGTIHTHPNGPRDPSEKDIEISKHIGRQVRAVWHLASGTVTIYNKTGVIDRYRCKYPLWFALLSKILFV